MPGRKYSMGGSGYRYGFNGKENDKDAGEGILPTSSIGHPKSLKQL
jgi:hypothetical protein